MYYETLVLFYKICLVILSLALISFKINYFIGFKYAFRFLYTTAQYFNFLKTYLLF